MKKTRSWFWFFIQLLPLIAFAFFMFARWGQGTAQYVAMYDFVEDFTDFSSQWAFEPVSNALTSVFNTFGSTELFGITIVLNFISFEVFVLLMRICYEVIVFLPKFCISFFERKM